MQIGAHYQGQGSCLFTVWAPFIDDLSVIIKTPKERIVKMKKDEKGYWNKSN